MITRPTVLVLGAGASAQYGFPLGPGLRDAVCRSALDGSGAKAYSSEEQLQYREFAERLRKSAYRSVDAFLEDFPTYVETGKRAIAWELIGCENEDRLFPPSSGASWYDLLAECLLSDGGLNAFGSNRLTIITYNYDRSLEHYLTTVIANRKAWDYPSALQALSALPILHLHGKLGSLADRPYSTDRAQLSLAAQGIRIVHEADGTSDGFAKAQGAIEAADRLYMFGFGYYSKNMERLGFTPRMEHRYRCKIWLGATGFTGPAWNALQTQYGIVPAFPEVGSHWGCLEGTRNLPWD